MLRGPLGIWRTLDFLCVCIAMALSGRQEIVPPLFGNSFFTDTVDECGSYNGPS